MRDIKFRAWDGEKMLQGQYLMNVTLGQALTWSDRLMQFTGFLDKNGKEIWEGDILRYTKNGRIEGQPKRESEKHYWVVYFDEKGQWRARRAGNNPEALFDKIRSHEVVGNLYENPELLPT